MPRRFLPKTPCPFPIASAWSDSSSLAAAEDHPVARFLLSEIGGAEIIPDDSNELESIVGMDSWIEYRPESTSPCCRQLVRR
jgi:hypothetical protein